MRLDCNLLSVGRSASWSLHGNTNMMGSMNFASDVDNTGVDDACGVECDTMNNVKNGGLSCGLRHPFHASNEDYFFMQHHLHQKH